MDHLENIYGSLGSQTKHLGTIGICELENKMYNLKIDELKRQIEVNLNTLKTVEGDVSDPKYQELLKINIQELELRVMTQQTAIKLNELRILRIKRSF